MIIFDLSDLSEIIFLEDVVGIDPAVKGHVDDVEHVTELEGRTLPEAEHVKTLAKDHQRSCILIEKLD